MISMAGTFDQIMIVNAKSPYQTLADFVTAAKAQPGKLNVGTINVGSTQHLGAELFKSVAGLNFQIIPFRTSPESIVALLRNDVQLVIAFLPAVEAVLADGRVRAVATSGATRAPYLPTIPTVKEAGVPGYELTAWNGLVAPHGTPDDVIATLNGHLKAILADPILRKRYLALGMVPASSSPEQLKTQLVSDISTYRKIVQNAGIPKR
jgi:tripartite-type tricarboxylate transporter receptor subunit TctC